MTYSRADHLAGVPRLVDPRERELAQRAFASDKGREKFLRRLAHQIEMHPDFSAEPPKGARDGESLFDALVKRGAPDSCYVIASDGDLDDTFQPLKDIVRRAHEEFGHGTILSCVPGKLALFRTARPHRHLIVRRP